MAFELKELDSKYDLELEKVVKSIKEAGAKSVLLQLPDGLKPYGLVLSDYIAEKTGVEVRIYLGDCFGSCDTPESDADMLVSFGHAEW